MTIGDVVDVDQIDAGRIDGGHLAIDDIADDLGDRRLEYLTRTDDPGGIDNDDRGSIQDEAVGDLLGQPLATHIVVHGQPDVERHGLVRELPARRNPDAGHGARVDDP